MVVHEYRDNLFKGWKTLSIEGDNISLQELNKQGEEIAKQAFLVSQIKSVQIAKSFGASFYCNITLDDGKKLRVHSGAIETFGSPYQRLESFAHVMKALLVREKPEFQIIVGSNGLYWFTIIAAVLTIPLVGMLLFISFFKGGHVPDYVVWKAVFVVGMIVAFGIPLMKMGKAKEEEQLDALPYGLELFMALAEKE